MDDVQDERWAEYLLEILNDMKIRTSSRIFEVACGTGRITIPLARHGYNIFALDISEEMLEKAQKKTREAGLSINYLCGDMTRFVISMQVEAIICACDGVNYLLNDEEVFAFFKTCWQNLNSDGILLFDVSSYKKLTKIIGNNLFYDDREDLTCLWQNNLIGDLINMELTLFIREKNYYKRMDEKHIQRAYRLNKIIHYLKDAGFNKVYCYNFHTKDPATEDNERIQFLAVKD